MSVPNQTISNIRTPEYCVISETDKDSTWQSGSKVFVRDTSKYYILDNGAFTEITGPGGGGVTSASNVGSTGIGVFNAKSGSDLQFRNLNVGSGIVASLDSPNHKIDVTPSYGTGANTVCQGNDSRLSDSRTPMAHASTHQDTGSDEMSVVGLSGLLADAQTPLAHTHVEDDVINLTIDLSARELIANKATLNGYASLDGRGFVPTTQIPIDERAILRECERKYAEIMINESYSSDRRGFETR